MNVLNLLGHLCHDLRRDRLHAAGFFQGFTADFKDDALIFRLLDWGGLVGHLVYLAQSGGVLAKTKESTEKTPMHLRPPKD